MGDSGTGLGVFPINRTGVQSSELCYEVVTSTLQKLSDQVNFTQNEHYLPAKDVY